MAAIDIPGYFDEPVKFFLYREFDHGDIKMITANTGAEKHRAVVQEQNGRNLRKKKGKVCRW